MTNNNNNKTLLGAQGEQIAETFLLQHGYKIIQKNWRFKHKEIDIIAQKEGKIVFIEVKTRSNEYFEPPSSAVTLKKQRLLIEAANFYLISKKIEMEARFDVVSIIKNNYTEKIELIENAFYPSITR